MRSDLEVQVDQILKIGWLKIDSSSTIERKINMAYSMFGATYVGQCRWLLRYQAKFFYSESLMTGT